MLWSQYGYIRAKDGKKLDRFDVMVTEQCDCEKVSFVSLIHNDVRKSGLMSYTQNNVRSNKFNAIHTERCEKVR